MVDSESAGLKRSPAKNHIAAWIQCWTWPYKPSWLVGSLEDIFILTLIFVFFQHINHFMYSPPLTLVVIISLQCVVSLAWPLHCSYTALWLLSWRWFVSFWLGAQGCECIILHGQLCRHGSNLRKTRPVELTVLVHFCFDCPLLWFLPLWLWTTR